MEYLDKPIPIAQALIAAELTEAIARYEPRAALKGVTVQPDKQVPGHVLVEVEVEL